MPYNKTFFSDNSFETPVAIVRGLLGLVLLIGGWKLAFPQDPQGLVEMYLPGGSWPAIHEPLVDWIHTLVGAESVSDSVLLFLQSMGWVEMTVGLALVAGFFTPWFAALAGLMFLSFAMANPDAGMIKLAIDVTMGGFALAVAFTGSGRWSLDSAMNWFPEAQASRKPWFLTTIRVFLLYAFVLGVLFPIFPGQAVGWLYTPGVFWFVSLVLVGMLLFPQTAKWACGAIAVWMLGIILVSVVQQVGDQGLAGIYWGLDSAKWHIGLLGGSLAYFLTGPDRVSIFPPGTRKDEEHERADEKVMAS